MTDQNTNQPQLIRPRPRYLTGFRLIVVLLVSGLVLLGGSLTFFTLTTSSPDPNLAEVAPTLPPETGLFTTQTETTPSLLQEVSAGVATGEIIQAPFTPQTFSVEQSGAHAVAWGDYDNDGDLDLAVGSGDPSHIHRNDNGQLTSEWVWAAGGGLPRSDFTRAIAWGDYDNDGDLDLAVGNGCDDSLDDVRDDVLLNRCSPHPSRIYGNMGNGQLTEIPVFSTPFTDVTKSIAWGDYDGDGDLDLFVGNLGPDRIYRNDHQSGDSNIPVFTSVWTSPFTDDTQSIALGDYDRDGDLDLVVGNGATNQGIGKDHPENEPARLYRNNCIAKESLPGVDCLKSNDLAAIFTPVWTQTDHIAYSKSVAWGDYDGDGWLDLVIGNEPLNVSVPPLLYRNVYSETGEQPPLKFDQSVGEETYNTRSASWGDYDGDGDLDLAIGNWTSPNQVFENVEVLAEDGITRERKFVEQWRSLETSRDRTNSIAWGDFDNDGDLDLAVGNEAISHLYRNNQGLLTTGKYWQSPEPEPKKSEEVKDSKRSYPNSIAWGDYDRDGWLDLAVGNGCNYTRTAEIERREPFECRPNQIYQYKGLDGEGVPRFITSTWKPIDQEFTTSVAWGDVNRDGWLDLAVGNDCSQKQTFPEACRSVRVYSNSNGVLETIATYSSVVTDNTLSIAWGDVDGDGWLDLAVGNGCDSGAQNCKERRNRLYRNINGTLEISPTWTSVDADDTFSVAWGDYDNDGDLDLMTGNQNNFPNRLYLNERGMLLTKGITLTNDSSVSVAWGDYDGDGNLDLATGNYNRPNHVYRNEGSLEADGITPKFTEVWSSFEIDLTSKVAWGDYDNDGDLDLLVGSWGGGNRVYRDDRGTLTPNAIWTSIADPTYSIAWGDYDSDGDLDLATGQGWVHAPDATERDILIYSNTRDAISSTTPLPLIHITRPQPPGNANFYSSPDILPGPITFVYTLTHPSSLPVRQVVGWYSLNGGGLWHQAVPTQTRTTTLTTSPTGVAHTYTWDVLNSGVLGQSDNVVFRLAAVPAISNTANAIPGPYLYGSYATTTFPFRVRGSQVRVVDETGQPRPNALVYRRPAGTSGKFAPYADLTGQPFRTDGQGYLQGRETITKGDQLVALLPVPLPMTLTNRFSRTVDLYYTSAAPTQTGVAGQPVTPTGVQTLIVSAANPLTLFNLNVSLEWDAQNDQTYRSQLQRDLQRASEILYDLSNGQMALGQINIYQAKEHWPDVDLVIHASNNIRPNANLGGSIWTAGENDEVYRRVEDNTPTTVANAYIPGQVRMGANWTRFGDLSGNLGEDWPRALAHELAHYLLFVPDNYLGLENDLVTQIECPGSVMTNPYRDDYSEFLTPTQWERVLIGPNGEAQQPCLQTLAQNTTRRADWTTILKFYPFLNAPGDSSSENPGPSTLPLQVTQVEFVSPQTPADTLADPFFNLTQVSNQAVFIENGRAEGYLFKEQKDSVGTNDQVIPLGAPDGDLLQARGAAVDDRLCLFDYSRSPMRVGCEFVSEGDRTLTLTQVPGSNWPPQVTVTPVNSRTFTITAAFSSAFTQTLGVQILSASGETATDYLSMDRLDPTTFRKTVTLDQTKPPIFNGFVRICAPDCNPRDGSSQEILVEFSLGDGWPVPSRPGGIIRPSPFFSYRRYYSGYRRRYYAPVSSGDGQVTFFNLDKILDNDSTYTLQSLPTAPNLPPWLTPVGQAYRFSTEDTLDRSSILFQYLERDVPPGQEEEMKVYYSGDEGQTWDRLEETVVKPGRNLASAKVRGQGIYALVSTIQIPLSYQGWNLFGYPVRGSRPVTEALASLVQNYTSVYHYDSTRSPQWKLHDRTVAISHPEFATWVNDLTDFEFGQAYWIHATTPTTLSLGVAQAPQITYTVLPPVTFYGPINETSTFKPEVGMPVVAKIDGKICGESVVESGQGDLAAQLVYKLQIKPPESCGVQGQNIVFEIDNQVMGGQPQWDNSQAQFYPLHGQEQLGHSLSVSKTAFPNLVLGGEMLTYTIYYTVTGNELAASLTIVDTLPQSLTVQNCQGGLSCSESAGQVTWNLGDVMPPAAGSVTLTAQVGSSLSSGTTLINQAVLKDNSGQRVAAQVATKVGSSSSSCNNELLVNGAMENNEGWILNLGAISAQYVPDPRGNGRSLYVGITGGQQPGRRTWSSARQTVTIPTGQSARLSLDYLLKADSWPGYDDQFVAILNNYGHVSKIWHISRNDSGQWQDFSQDISQFAGQTIKVYVGVTNDGFGGATSLVVDNVSLCVK